MLSFDCRQQKQREMQDDFVRRLREAHGDDMGDAATSFPGVHLETRWRSRVAFQCGALHAWQFHRV